MQLQQMVLFLNVFLISLTSFVFCFLEICEMNAEFSGTPDKRLRGGNLEGDGVFSTSGRKSRSGGIVRNGECVRDSEVVSNGILHAGPDTTSPHISAQLKQFHARNHSTHPCYYTL